MPTLPRPTPPASARAWHAQRMHEPCTTHMHPICIGLAIAAGAGRVGGAPIARVADGSVQEAARAAGGFALQAGLSRGR